LFGVKPLVYPAALPLCLQRQIEFGVLPVHCPPSEPTGGHWLVADQALTLVDLAMEGAITAPCIAPDGTLAGVVGVANAGARTFTDAEQESLLAHGRRLAQVRAAARVADSGTELRHMP
jgi:hypothetical protein